MVRESERRFVIFSTIQPQSHTGRNLGTTHVCMLTSLSKSIEYLLGGHACRENVNDHVCEGQRQPVLEFSDRFMSSTNLKFEGHMLSLLHALTITQIHTRLYLCLFEASY